MFSAVLDVSVFCCFIVFVVLLCCLAILCFLYVPLEEISTDLVFVPGIPADPKTCTDLVFVPELIPAGQKLIRNRGTRP